MSHPQLITNVEWLEAERQRLYADKTDHQSAKKIKVIEMQIKRVSK
jgi:hypothetical protein